MDSMSTTNNAFFEVDDTQYEVMSRHLRVVKLGKRALAIVENLNKNFGKKGFK